MQPALTSPRTATSPAMSDDLALFLPGPDTVYFGRVHALTGSPESPTYVYERSVFDVDGDRVSIHVTRDLTGAVQLDESARHSLDYALLEYALRADQRGQHGVIEVAGGYVTFRRVRRGRSRTRVERVRDPVVVGPTLVGYIAHHLAALRAGGERRVRLAILDRLGTVGFCLTAASASSEETVVVMKPTSALIALFVRPIRFTFDARGRVTMLEGRVPTKIRRRGRLRDFDARVVYEYASSEYR